MCRKSVDEGGGGMKDRGKEADFVAWDAVLARANRKRRRENGDRCTHTHTHIHMRTRTHIHTPTEDYNPEDEEVVEEEEEYVLPACPLFGSVVGISGASG